MCGICGVIDLNGRGVDEKSLVDMRESLAHRGPDDAGLYLDDHAGLGHRRLSIIDLSEQGRQPLQNEDGTVWVICNGEVYNHRDLRQQLLDRGHKFRSNSDTEVVVHAYEEWGLEKTIGMLKGMFALALWDKNEGVLWLARDRLGVKPLFYAQHMGKFLFSSEVHALYEHVDVSPDRIDRGALDYYLAFGYIPPDRCLIRGIQKLPPAHILKYDRDGIRCWRYWDVGFLSRTTLSFQDQVEQVDQLLTSAVTRRLQSDVPVGSFLSSGIDSGLVTAIAARNLDTPLRTFTVKFEGTSPDQDETALAQLVAQRYGTRHEQLVVDPGDKSPLPYLMYHTGEPFFDVGILPAYQIARSARDHITVALTGDGGDESFCGYYNVYTSYLAGRIKRWIPAPLRSSIERLINSSSVRGSMPSLVRRLGTLLRYADQTPTELYDYPNWWHSAIRADLYEKEWLDGQAKDEPLAVIEENFARVRGVDDVEQILYTDLHLRLPGDYLTKLDVSSSVVPLELRSPFLDHELVEFAATLPPSSKMYRWQQKGMLRQLARKYLPANSVEQPKIGFGPPLGDWLRGDWAPMMVELVANGIALRPGLFNETLIRRLVDEHLEGRFDHSTRIWSLACLEIWWRIFIDRTMGPGDEF